MLLFPLFYNYCFQVDLGHGVLVDAANLQYVSSVEAKKTTYTVCEVVFTRDELANSSLTGKKSNAFLSLDVKEQLDTSRVKAVVGTLSLQHFPPHLYAVLISKLDMHR